MTHRLRILPFSFICLLLVGGLGPVRAQQIAVDGVFFDWQPEYQIDVGAYEELTYEEGDMETPDPENTSYRIDVDIKDVYAYEGDDSLYIRVALNDAADLVAAASDTSIHGGPQVLVYFDVDNDTATGLSWGWWGSGLDGYVQVWPQTESQRYPMYEHSQAGNSVWEFFPTDDTTLVHAVWGPSNNDVEIAVPLSALNNPRFVDGDLGQSIALVVEASESEGPWRADYAPPGIDIEGNPGIPLELASRAGPAPITVDGVFFDWTSEHQIDIGSYEELTYEEGDPETPDPDNTSYRIDVDIKDVYSALGGDSLYVRVALNDAADLVAAASDTSIHGGPQVLVYFDVDNDTATGLTWGWWGSGLDAYVQVWPPSENQRYPVYEHSQAGNSVWDFIPTEDTTLVHAVWAPTNNDVEIAIPLSMLNAPSFIESALGDSLAIVVEASESEGPWRADYAPPGIDIDGNPGIPVYVRQTPTAAEDDDLPSAFRLHGNYPNPFNPSTNIRFELGTTGPVQVRVFDLLGREIALLIDHPLQAGIHEVRFEAGSLPSGVYFYQVESDLGHRTGTMMLLK